MSLSKLMAKPENNKSVWQQTKSVFNDGTEILSEAFEGTAELVKAFRKSMNLMNMQLDEMIIVQKLNLVNSLVESGFKEEEAIAIILAQINN